MGCRALAFVLLASASGCGRIAFDPLGDCAFDMCTSFEGPNVDPGWVGAGILDFDYTLPRTGSKSLRLTQTATSPGTESGSYFGVSGAYVTNARQLYARVWMMISANPVASNTLDVAKVIYYDGVGEFVYLRNDDLELFNQFDNQQVAAGAAVPVNTWFCLNWHVVLATGATGSSTLETDLFPPLSIANSITNGSPPGNQLLFGPHFSAANIQVMNPAFALWVDDIIIDDSRPISCDD